MPLILSYTAYSSALSPEFKNPKWGKFNVPTWPPESALKSDPCGGGGGGPVPCDTVPIDSFDFLLLASGLILVYVMFQRKNGRTWKEIFSFSNVCSFLASKT